MSSILKILVDIQCTVYCDFVEIGEANPYSLFKMELRKGSYIIDFKKDDINLKSIKYDKSILKFISLLLQSQIPEYLAFWQHYG